MRAARPRKLTKDQLDALRSIRSGADILGADLAGILRSIQATHPELITISSQPQTDCEADGKIFLHHAKPTALGLKAIE